MHIPYTVRSKAGGALEADSVSSTLPTGKAVGSDLLSLLSHLRSS